MRICVYGPGAIGAHLAVLLARAGETVSVVARGPHLAAIRAGGLTLDIAGQRLTVPVAASEHPADLGLQDVVIVAVKAHQTPALAGPIQPLLGPETMVVMAQNGVPWWYFHRLDGPLEGRHLESVDPGGALWRGIGPQRAVGCVVFTAGTVVAPGVVRHQMGDSYPLGEPDGSRSPRVLALSAVLERAGLRAPVSPRIRDELWLKLWGNLCINPISALTGATMLRIVRDPGTRALAARMMQEGRAVAEALGARMALGIDERLEMAAEVGEHKTSMLQDLERGQPMEIDGLVGVVAEFGRLTGIATPAIDAVLALLRQRAAVAGLAAPLAMAPTSAVTPPAKAPAPMAGS